MVLLSLVTRCASYFENSQYNTYKLQLLEGVHYLVEGRVEFSTLHTTSHMHVNRLELYSGVLGRAPYNSPFGLIEFKFINN